MGKPLTKEQVERLHALRHHAHAAQEHLRTLIDMLAPIVGDASPAATSFMDDVKASERFLGRYAWAVDAIAYCLADADPDA